MKKLISTLLSISLLCNMVPESALITFAEEANTANPEEITELDKADENLKDEEQADEESASTESSVENEEDGENVFVSSEETEEAISENSQETVKNESAPVEDDDEDRDQQLKVITAWQWIDPEEMLIYNDSISGWGLGLPGADADHLVTRDLLNEFLPKEVRVEFDHQESETLPVAWDLSSFPASGTYQGTYTFPMILPEKMSLSENAEAMVVVVDLGGASLYANTLNEIQLQDHIVSDAVMEIDGVQVNLFDYWVLYENPTKGDILTKSERHIRAIPSQWGNNAQYSTSADWWKGINENHLLIFGDGVIHAGLWNKGAGETTEYGKRYAGMEGIVKPLLENGYPVINLNAARQVLTGVQDINDQNYRDHTLIGDYKLSGDHIDSKPLSIASDKKSVYPYEGANIQNLSNSLIDLWEKGTNQKIETGTESLAYLFDPNIQNPYKKSYQNILGLFQIDNEGYYYYNMRQNFAEFQETKVQSKSGNSDGKFILYDAGATQRSDGDENSIGNFFPFNKGTEVFNGIKSDGTLSSKGIGCSNNTTNHHLGMTIDINFRQPVNGMITMNKQNNPMTFGFSGDDDVWIFIDDVLVLDLGGVHSEIYGIIDFATGNVLIGQGYKTLGIPSYDSEHPENTQDLVAMTNLRELFRTAGKESEMNWNGNTFASGSDHSLKMFYLERGNYDSSLALRFNLQPRLYQQIKKVDQNGNPINGVEFRLYEAEVANNAGKLEYGIKDINNPLASLITGKTLSNEKLDAGVALFEEMGADGNYRPFNFADRYKTRGIQYYILKEVNTPDGYRPLPVDIVLEYNPDTTMLSVVNKYTTGAYASFTSTITGNNKISYGIFNNETSSIDSSDVFVNETKQSEGLIVAVPMLWQENFGESGKWIALYGSNTAGFNASAPTERSAAAWRKAILKAVLYQCSDIDSTTPNWYLDWNDETNRLEGTMKDLPGQADRYQQANAIDPDMKMIYMLIDPEVFTVLNIQVDNSEARYQALGAYVNQRLNQGATIDEIVEMIDQIKPDSAVTEDGFDSCGVSFLNVDHFIRNFRSLIYIPNEQRELRVWKIDQNGIGVNAVTFSLYNDPECEGTPIATGVTANVDGIDGTLIFAPYSSNTQGHAKMEWSTTTNTKYYLKETAAPEGYELNPTVITVVVGTYSIYADAGEADDGVSVMAGVGKLTQTMVKYAADENVNITLRDITAYAQKQQSGNFDQDSWEDIYLDGTQTKRLMNLHYGKNTIADYGLHEEDGAENLYPFFVTDTGFIRTRITQNYDALRNESELKGENPTYGDSNRNNASKDKIDGDITSLFSLLNIVVVTDINTQETEKGQLTISKTVVGNSLTQEESTRNFNFKITLKDQNGQELEGRYNFYRTDKVGNFASGEIVPFHHDESVTILGLPVKTIVTIEEIDADAYLSYINGDFYEDKKINVMIEDGSEVLVSYQNVKKTEVFVNKTWLDGDDKYGLRPESIEVTLLQNGETYLTKSLSEETNWKTSFKDLPKYDLEGNVYRYTLKEAEVEKYQSQIQGGEIINALMTDITVLKQWEDEEDRFKIRPEKIQINLVQEVSDQKKVIETVELSEEDLDEDGNWRHTFENLPLFNSENEEFSYSIEEKFDEMDSYSVRYEDAEMNEDAELTLKVVNSLKMGEAKLVKFLNRIKAGDQATFIFSVEAKLNGETIYGNMLSLEFDEIGPKSISLGKFPVGAEITIEEVYSGSSYELVGGDRIQVLKIEESEDETAVVAAEFTNDYNGRLVQGSSIKNSYVHKETKDGNPFIEVIQGNRIEAE